MLMSRFFFLNGRSQFSLIYRNVISANNDKTGCARHSLLCRIPCGRGEKSATTKPEGEIHWSSGASPACSEAVSGEESEIGRGIAPTNDGGIRDRAEHRAGGGLRLTTEPERELCRSSGGSSGAARRCRAWRSGEEWKGRGLGLSVRAVMRGRKG